MKKLTTILLTGAAALGFASAAQAADLIITPPPGVIVDERPVGNWDGVYIGAFGGIGWALADHLADPPNNDLNLAGYLLGVQAGANVSVGNGIVLGVVGDVAATNISAAEDFGGVFGTITQTIDWMATFRGKAGFDGGTFLPYLTAGLAVAGGTRDSTGGGATDSQIHTGWAAGAGVDVAVADNVSLNLEFLHADLGEAVYDTGGISPTIHLTTQRVTAGINFRF